MPSPTLRIAVDTNCRHVTLAGTTRYLNGLVSELRKTQENQITELCWPVDNLEYRQPTRVAKTIYRELIWAPFHGKRSLSQLNIDVFHSPAGFLIPPPNGVPHVTTLHDLSILHHPKRYRFWQRSIGPFRLKQTCQTRHIITVSKFTADEAMKICGVSSDCLFPVYHGCDFHQGSPEASPVGFEVPSEFLLFVGSLEPGKNLALLLDVYELANHLRIKLPPLVVVGVRWEGVKHEGRWPPNWMAAGRISDSELVYLYRRAVSLVFPSKYEGFGLPPLEAMTLGCPVICSPVASLPEVVGDAAFFATSTATDYLRAIRELMAARPRRDESILCGLEQAQRFSWNKCSKETIEVYEKARA